MTDFIAELLDQQADEIARAGYPGWGNTMLAAASRIAEFEKENSRLRALVQKKDEAIGIAMKYMPFNPQSETLVADLSALTRAYSLDAENPAGTPPDADQLSLNGEGGITRRRVEPAEQPQTQAVPTYTDVYAGNAVAIYKNDVQMSIDDILRDLRQPRAAVPDYLRQRCIEIMEWRRTGVVKQNGALAALAATLTKHDDHDRMRGAEIKTVSEVIALLAACSTPPTCAAVPDGYRLVPIEAPQEVIARLWAIQNSIKPTYLWKELLELCPIPPTGGAGHE